MKAVVQPIELPSQQAFDDVPFPLVLQCEAGDSVAAMLEYVGENRRQLLEAARRHGAVLFRDFGVKDAVAFDAFAAAFGLPNFPYQESLSNAVRVNVTERVFTANEAPPEVAIYLHHEMAQTPVFPEQLFFYCQQPAEEGGETPLCRSDVLLQRLAEQRPDFVADCERKGLRYSNVMPSQDDPASGMGRSWQSTLGADDRAGAESRLEELNYTWMWQEDGCLRVTSPMLPAVREIEPGRRVFFNQLIAAFQGWKDSRNDPSKAIRHGDNSPLDRDAVLTAAALAEELTFDTPWQRGDVALVDNFVTMHGRRTFQGIRQVLASLASPQRA